MTKFFISYSRTIQNDVQIVTQDLVSVGHEVWVDHKLTGGQSWWEEILKQIRLCDVFIYAISPDTVDSQACNRELGYACDLNKPILPIKIAEVSNKLLRPSVAERQQVNYVNVDPKTALIALLKATRELPAAPELPDPLPIAPPVPVSYLAELRERIDKPELSMEEQSTIIVDLEDKMHDDKDIEDILALLRLFKDRPNNYAKIDKKITALIDLTSKMFQVQLKASSGYESVSKPVRRSAGVKPKVPNVSLSDLDQLRERIEQPLLSMDDQNSICGELTAQLENDNDRKGVEKLLKLFLKRNDIYAITEKNLVVLLNSLQGSTNSSSSVDKDSKQVANVFSAPVKKTHSLEEMKPLNIDLSNAEPSVNQILNSVLEFGGTWVIESDKINKLTITSNIERKKRYLSAQIKCRDKITEEKQNCLKELGWKINDNAVAAIAGGALAYATAGAGALLALGSKKVRDFILTFEATREWKLSKENIELPKISAELTRILGLITQNDLPLLASHSVDA